MEMITESNFATAMKDPGLLLDAFTDLEFLGAVLGEAGEELKALGGIVIDNWEVTLGILVVAVLLVLIAEGILLATCPPAGIAAAILLKLMTGVGVLTGAGLMIGGLHAAYRNYRSGNQEAFQKAVREEFWVGFYSLTSVGLAKWGPDIARKAPMIGNLLRQNPFSQRMTAFLKNISPKSNQAPHSFKVFPKLSLP